MTQGELAFKGRRKVTAPRLRRVLRYLIQCAEQHFRPTTWTIVSACHVLAVNSAIDELRDHGVPVERAENYKTPSGRRAYRYRIKAENLDTARELLGET